MADPIRNKVVYKLLQSAFSLILVTGVSAAAGACSMEETIQQVKEQHTAELMALPGVVSVGVGRGSGGEMAIIVGVESADTAAIATLPKQIGGYPVETRITGRPAAQ